MTKKMSTKKTVANNTVVGDVSVYRLVIDYIEFSSELYITRGDSASWNLWETVGLNKQFGLLHLLFEKVFSAPATSAPAERVFSSSGLLLRPHRARMSDQLMSELFLLTCNKHVACTFVFFAVTMAKVAVLDILAVVVLTGLPAFRCVMVVWIVTLQHGLVVELWVLVLVLVLDVLVLVL